MLDLLADYEQHPDEYHDGTYREPPEHLRPGYIDFYRAQAYMFMVEAYAKAHKAPLSPPRGGTIDPVSKTIEAPSGAVGGLSPASKTPPTPSPSRPAGTWPPRMAV